MKISVLYFASLRQAVGTPNETIEIADGATLDDLVAEVGRRHSAVEKFRTSMMLARNQEWVDGASTLSDGDEIALMPPVSGG